MWRCPRCGKWIVDNKIRTDPPRCPKCGCYMRPEPDFYP